MLVSTCVEFNTFVTIFGREFAFFFLVDLDVVLDVLFRIFVVFVFIGLVLTRIVPLRSEGALVRGFFLVFDVLSPCMVALVEGTLARP